MANVLVVEPYRILQQAISLSLTQEHVLELREAIAARALTELRDCDLLVLDAAALAEKNLLGADLVEALRSVATPVVWLASEGALEPPEREKLKVVRLPLEPKALKDAIGSLLTAAGRAHREAEGEEAAAAEGGASAGEQRGAPAHAADPIELVDVVAEESTSAENAPHKERP
ncbi:MAG TPA: hypothetical protein VNL14_16325 [Candidatus Acidoferrales bacterium]|nr:hypothetical protein [Candidatus Acidoferrales bacterium]